MKTSIFVRSYRGDREWLRYSLRSLEKNAFGFHETIVALSHECKIHFDGFPFGNAKVVYVDDPGPCEPYKFQQYVKLNADQYCEGDYILFVDSDTLCDTYCTPRDFTNNPTWEPEFVVKTKPVQLLGHWSEVGDAQMWKPITTKALGVEPPFEGMRCMPIIHDRRTLPLLREYMESVHGKSLLAYITEQPHRDFSEFNLLSAFAHRFLPHLYEWRIADVATDGYPRTFKQFWSWAGYERHKEQLDDILNA